MRWGPMLVLVAFCAPGVGAQETPSPRRLSFTASAGVMLRGPVSGVESRLGGLGYGHTDPGGCTPFLLWEICSGPTSYPRLIRGGAGSFTVRYETSSRWATSVGLATNDFGSATGNTVGNILLDVSWKGTTGWIAAHYKPREWLSLGAGPALHSFNGGAAESVMRLGLMAEMGVRIPARSRLFVATTLRGHIVPGSRVVPHHMLSSGLWGPAGPTVPLLVKWGHQTLDVGLGLRL